MAANRPESADANTTELGGTKIKWDDTNMKSAYANVCNVTSTREEVVMLFGMKQAWKRGQKEVVIQLTDRIVVSPNAAKRLGMLLGGVVKEYESRFGVLSVDLPPGQRSGRHGCTFARQGRIRSPRQPQFPPRRGNVQDAPHRGHLRSAIGLAVRPPYMRQLPSEPRPSKAIKPIVSARFPATKRGG
jgi:hypothetical protein